MYSLVETLEDMQDLPGGGDHHFLSP